jgi:hypothetical protein
VAADDDAVVSPSEHRLHQAELAQAPGQGLELILVDPARVGGVGPEAIESNFVDG